MLFRSKPLDVFCTACKGTGRLSEFNKTAERKDKDLTPLPTNCVITNENGDVVRGKSNQYYITGTRKVLSESKGFLGTAGRELDYKTNLIYADKFKDSWPGGNIIAEGDFYFRSHNVNVSDHSWNVYSYKLGKRLIIETRNVECFCVAYGMLVEGASVINNGASSVSSGASRTSESSESSNTSGTGIIRLQTPSEVKSVAFNNNTTKGDIYFVIAFYKNNTWISKGWFKLAQGEEKVLFNQEYDSDRIYYHAKTLQGTYWGDKDVEFCVDKNNAFEISNQNCPSKAPFKPIIFTPYTTNSVLHQME